MGYVLASQQEARSDDTSAQIARMNDLILKAEHNLEKIKEYIDEFSTTGKLKFLGGKQDPAKYLDSELWNIEIDIENSNDLCRRLTEDNSQSIREKLKSFFPSIF